MKSGKIKLEYKYLPLPQFEPEASIAAQAAECAADQDLFWPFHDQVFDAAQSQGRGALRVATLIDYAEAMGMDRSTFSSCMSGSLHVGTIQASREEASTLGVGSTPTVFINGTQAENAFDVDGITAEIERLLAGS